MTNRTFPNQLATEDKMDNGGASWHEGFILCRMDRCRISLLVLVTALCLAPSCAREKGAGEESAPGTTEEAPRCLQIQGEERCCPEGADLIGQGPPKSDSAVCIKDGKSHGFIARFSESGQIVLLGQFEQGAESGSWTTWYPNGARKTSGAFVAGKKHGTWNEWYEDGKDKRVVTYHMGSEENLKEWDPEGWPIPGDFRTLSWGMTREDVAKRIDAKPVPKPPMYGPGGLLAGTGIGSKMDFYLCEAMGGTVGLQLEYGKDGKLIQATYKEAGLVSDNRDAIQGSIGSELLAQYAIEALESKYGRPKYETDSIVQENSLDSSISTRTRYEMWTWRTERTVIRVDKQTDTTTYSRSHDEKRSFFCTLDYISSDHLDSLKKKRIDKRSQGL